MELIKKFPDDSILEKGRGSFDDWCIYLTRPKIPKHAPRDVDYFQRLIELSEIHTAKKIYNDFVKIYELTTNEKNPNTLNQITKIASEYNGDQLEIDILYTILYMGMIAEENKAYTKLGKRIKRLGMYQILVERVTAIVAANYSKGKDWKTIAKECEKRGF